MKLIECIPIGKQNKETREMLMNKANLTLRQFRKELVKLRNKYIIINDNGYYLPANKEEMQEFIQNLNGQAYEINKIINLAYRKMEGLDEK